jgi:hypothetical protein
MIEIVLLISGTYFIQSDDGNTLPRDTQPLLPGNYFIVANGSVEVNNEVVVPRTISLSTGTRVQEFKDLVRKRDRGCVVTKKANVLAEYDLWTGFEAAHIFPLGYERYWRDHNFGRWITLPTTKGETINSVQNGLLLDAGVHSSFDQFHFSINPDVSGPSTSSKTSF